MFEPPTQAFPLARPTGDHATITLFPLVDKGQAALVPDIPAGVLNIALSGTVLLWHNAFNEITIRKADDLFACAASEGKYYDPLPKGAELIQATLDVQFVEAAEPHFVDIVPPHTLTLQHPEDAPRIFLLLARLGFRLTQKLALALLLAATCASDAPFADADESDEPLEVEGGKLHAES